MLGNANYRRSDDDLVKRGFQYAREIGVVSVALLVLIGVTVWSQVQNVRTLQRLTEAIYEIKGAIQK